MGTRALGPLAGFGWLKDALNLGRGNPAAIFGGAALLMVAVFAVAIVAMLLQAGVMLVLGQGLASMVIGMLVLSLAVLVVLAMLLVGFLRVIDAVESGRRARAFDVFGGFTDLPASLRMIGFIVLLAVLQNVVVFGLMAVFAGGVMEWYLATMQASMAGAVPAAALPDGSGLGIAGLLMLVAGLFFYGVQAIGVGQIALRGRGVPGALGDGFAGAVRNLLPLLVFTLTGIAAAVLAGIALLLVAMLLGVLAKLVGVWLAVVLGVPMYLLLLLAVYVVMFGAMYHLWRGVCGDDTVAPTPASTPTEALTA